MPKRERQLRRHFREEIKLDAVRAALADDKSFELVAKEHGITANLLWYWRKRYAAKIESSENITPGTLPQAATVPAQVSSTSPDSHASPPQDDVKELRALNQQLLKENHLLKALLEQYLAKDRDGRY